MSSQISYITISCILKIFLINYIKIISINTNKSTNVGVNMKQRCYWAENNNILIQQYHDHEWEFPV